jgi:hypothetical protein
MKDIFISYAREDLDVARQLALALEGEGLSVWWDKEIPAGRTFDDVIEEAIKAANCVLVLWSHHSAQSNWVRLEAEEGRSRAILVPAFIEEVEIPFAFKNIQTANLIGWSGQTDHPHFKRLVTDIKSILGQKTVPGEKDAATSSTGKKGISNYSNSKNKRRLLYGGIGLLVVAVLTFWIINGTFTANKNVVDTTDDEVVIDTIKKVTKPVKEVALSSFLKVNIKPHDPRFVVGEEGEVMNWGGGSQSLFLTCDPIEQCTTELNNSIMDYKVWETMRDPSYMGIELDVDAVYNPVGNTFSCIIDEWGVKIEELESPENGTYHFYGTGGAEGYRSHASGKIKPSKGFYPVATWMEADNGLDTIIAKPLARNFTYFKPNEIIGLRVVITLRDVDVASMDQIFSGSMQFYARVNINGIKDTVYSRERILFRMPSKPEELDWKWSNSSAMEDLRPRAYITD